MSIPGSANPLLLASAAVPTGYQIERSVRFNSADSAYLSRTPASSGNRKTWTWAGWAKKSQIAPGGDFFFVNGSPTPGEYFICNWYDAGMAITDYSYYYFRMSDVGQKLRDPSSWYHIVITLDSTNATAANRLRVYINGLLLSSPSYYPTAITLDQEFGVNRASSHQIGRFNGYLADIHFIDGQALDPTSFGEFDNNGIWQPIAYSGSYGTNGFHLDFADNSTAAALGTDTSGNGNDWTVNNLSVEQSTPNYAANWSGSMNAGYSWESVFTGVGNGALPTYGAAYSQTTVTLPANVTWSSSIELDLILYTSGGGVIVNGLDVTGYLTSGGSRNWNDLSSALGSSGTLSTITLYQANSNYSLLYAVRLDGVTLIQNLGAGNDSLVDVPTNGTETDTGLGGEVRGNYATWNPLLMNSSYMSARNGNLEAVSQNQNYNPAALNVHINVGGSNKWYCEFSFSATLQPDLTGFGLSLASSSIFGTNQLPGSIYMPNGQKSIGGSKSSYGSTYTSSDIIGVSIDESSGALVCYKNGVSQGTLNTLSSGEYQFIGVVYGTDIVMTVNAGQRPFAYPAPSGFKALCTANLPAPVVTKPSEYMDVKLYTGNGSTQTISGLEFSPDLVWIKNRAQLDNHKLLDTVRGATEELESNTTDAEVTNADGLTAFNSDGFDLGADVEYNTSTEAYVAWAWDAGSSTVTNTDGSITSQVRANPSAGFSVVTYTGTGSNATVGHGLNVAPSLIIVKCRSAANDWAVYHTANTADPKTDYLLLNSTAATADDNTYWNDTAPTSAVLSIGTNAAVNTSTATYVAYCFAPVESYNAFGRYQGNGSADGPFVFCNFRPRWVLLKNTSQTANWVVVDAARLGYNAANSLLFPDGISIEAPGGYMDLLSNGFKILSSLAELNQNTSQYIYACFSENPFALNARAR